MSKKSKDYIGQIPFDVFGNQLHYPEGWPRELKAENFTEDGVYVYSGWPQKLTKIHFQDSVKKYAEPKLGKWSDKNGPADVIGEVPGVIEVDNYKFKDTLTYSHYARGRSAAYFKFTRSDGREVTVFLKDFENIVKYMVKGQITGEFTFCKRGQNFGCKLINE